MQRSLFVVVTVIAIASGGAAGAQQGDFVQASSTLIIPDLAECVIGNVYQVPAGKKLRIDWMSIRELASGVCRANGGDLDTTSVRITSCGQLFPE